MKKIKKGIAFVLALAMVLSLAPEVFTYAAEFANAGTVDVPNETTSHEGAVAFTPDSSIVLDQEYTYSTSTDIAEEFSAYFQPSASGGYVLTIQVEDTEDNAYEGNTHLSANMYYEEAWGDCSVYMNRCVETNSYDFLLMEENEYQICIEARGVIHFTLSAYDGPYAVINGSSVSTTYGTDTYAYVNAYVTEADAYIEKYSWSWKTLEEETWHQIAGTTQRGVKVDTTIPNAVYRCTVTDSMNRSYSVDKYCYTRLESNSAELDKTQNTENMPLKVRTLNWMQPMNVKQSQMQQSHINGV